MMITGRQLTFSNCSCYNVYIWEIHAVVTSPLVVHPVVTSPSFVFVFFFFFSSPIWTNTPNLAYHSCTKKSSGQWDGSHMEVALEALVVPGILMSCPDKPYLLKFYPRHWRGLCLLSRWTGAHTVSQFTKGRAGSTCCQKMQCKDNGEKCRSSPSSCVALGRCERANAFFFFFSH